MIPMATLRSSSGLVTGGRPASVRRTLRWSLNSEFASAGEARHLTAEALTQWDLPIDSSDVLLVVSELVTNAIQHGDPPVILTLQASGSALEVSVHDGGQSFVHERRQQAVGGRGLMIVELVSGQWGIEAEASGKRVWCRMPVSSASPTTDD
jgi:anti-sigma regulatory factor (Ser/Thr protein kinase)